MSYFNLAKFYLFLINKKNILKPNPDPTADDDLESNLLKPAGMMLRPATFIMKLYRAEDIPQSLLLYLNSMKTKLLIFNII